MGYRLAIRLKQSTVKLTEVKENHESAELVKAKMLYMIQALES